eukprot:scaffold120476_cov35-Tisochrysis_lutea.AAC.1
MSGYSAEDMRVPDGFEPMLKDFMREILRAKPDDIVRFGCDYFSQKLESGAPPPRMKATPTVTSSVNDGAAAE